MLAEGMAPEGMKYPALESTPILAEGRLYLCSSRNKVVALDPETGREIWAHDPQIDMRGLHLLNCRGVTYFDAAQVEKGAACRGRIITGTLDGRLLALDAATGEPCAGFGEQRRARSARGTRPQSSRRLRDQLAAGRRRQPHHRRRPDRGLVPHRHAGRRDPRLRRATPARWPGRGTRCRRASRMPPRPTRPSRTSARRRMRGRCSRSMPSAVSCSCRPATRRSISTVAIAAVSRTVATTTRARSSRSKRQPVVSSGISRPCTTTSGTTTCRRSRCCSTAPRNDGAVPALVQPTKQGHLFVLDRATGEPLVPVEERPVPQDGAVAGEYLSPTQPFPANRRVHRAQAPR